MDPNYRPLPALFLRFVFSGYIPLSKIGRKSVHYNHVPIITFEKVGTRENPKVLKFLARTKYGVCVVQFNLPGDFNLSEQEASEVIKSYVDKGYYEEDPIIDGRY